NRVESKLLVERHCERDCPAERGYAAFPMGRSLSTSSSNSSDPLGHPPPYHPHPATTHIAPDISSKEPVHLISKTIIHNKPPKTKEEIEREKEEARALFAEDEDDYLRETNEQTLRMFHAHISPLLLNISGATVITKEYQYFQLMRQVVEAACPNDFVPKLLLRGLMRMFRQLLWETQESFTHSESGDEDQHKRTLNVLKYCVNMTRAATTISNLGGTTLAPCHLYVILYHKLYPQLLFQVSNIREQIY
ncbi:unnamed protein product, partial [Orchesella dallaii]